MIRTHLAEYPVPPLIARLFTALKIVAFVAVWAVIWFKADHALHFFSTSRAILVTAFTHRYACLICILLLGFANVGIEALKWQYSITQIADTSFGKALKAVLAGQALNLIIPLGLGDAIGRVFSADGKYQTAGAVWACRGCQMAITWAGGLLGSLLFISYNTIWVYSMLSVSAIGCMVMLVFAFFYKTGGRWLGKWRLVQVVRPFFELPQAYHFRQWAWLLTLSFVRYALFSTQFVLFFYFIGCKIVSLPIVYAAVCMVFFAKSLLPSLHVIQDIGVRELAALLFFPLIGIAETSAVLASLLLWCTNILLPSLGGGLLVLALKRNVSLS